MMIDEKLARGLKDRFFRDFHEEISEAFRKEVRSMSLRSVKRGKWVKAARAYVGRLERFSIASYEGGSKVKPYFVTTVLEILDSREYNTWNEKCLYPQQLLLAFDPAYVGCEWGFFNIGEHAIIRLFMRSPVGQDTKGNLLPYSIIKQLGYVPFWTTFWIWFHLMTKEIDFRNDLSIVIPAPDGFFLAHLSTEETAVEIRTFIDDKSAGDDRKIVRDLMVQISTLLLDSPLSAAPIVEIAKLDYGNVFLTPAVCKLLAPHSDVLARCFFKKAETGQLFRQQLSLLAARADSYWSQFVNTPLRAFLVQMNHLLRSHQAKSASGGAG